jgi:hypothetical protein
MVVGAVQSAIRERVEFDESVKLDTKPLQEQIGGIGLLGSNLTLSDCLEADYGIENVLVQLLRSRVNLYG